MFLMKQLGTPYHVSVLLVGSPNTECQPRWVAVCIRRTDQQDAHVVRGSQ